MTSNYEITQIETNEYHARGIRLTSSPTSADADVWDADQSTPAVGQVWTDAALTAFHTNKPGGITMELTPISEINSSYIQHEAALQGVTHARYVGEAGEGENHITVWELTGLDGYTFRVANTNGLPIWEEDDMQEFAEMLSSVGFHEV